MAPLRTTRSLLLLAAAAIGAAWVAASAAAQPAPAGSRLPSTPRAVVDVGEAPAGAPAIGGGHAYLAFLSGRLVAYRLTDGGEAWRVALTAVQPPAALDGLVFVATDGALHALRARDGGTAWRVDTPAPVAPLLAREGWLIAATAARLTAYRAADGSVVWTRENPPLTERPAIEGDRLYAPRADHRLQAIDLPTGRDVWLRRLGGPPTAALPFADRVFVGSADGYFYCLDAARGTILWRFRVGAALRGQPAAEGALVYTVSLDNLVRAYDRRHGARTWNKGIPYRALAGPLVLGGSLVVPGPAPQLPVFGAPAGGPEPPLAFDGPLAAPLAVGHDGRYAILAAVVGEFERGWRLVLLDASYAVPLAPLTAMPGEPVPPWWPGK